MSSHASAFSSKIASVSAPPLGISLMYTARRYVRSTQKPVSLAGVFDLLLSGHQGRTTSLCSGLSCSIPSSRIARATSFISELDGGFSIV